MARWTEPHRRPGYWVDHELQEIHDRHFPPTMRRRGPQIAAFIGILLVLTAAALTLASLAGAQQVEQTCTRPYANLTADQLPNLCTVQFDGAGHAQLAGNNPDNSLVWHVATYHVPNPDQWDEQTPVVDTVLPVGSFNLTLACEPGAAQVDVWLDGETEPYVAATTLACGGPCSLNFAVPAPDAQLSVSERHDDAPCGVRSPAAGAPSGQTGPDISNPVLSPATNTTPTNPPVGVASSAAETTVAPSTVVSAAAATTLANTGRHLGWLAGIGIFLAVAGMVLALVGPGLFRKERTR